jgi:trigger factor
MQLTKELVNPTKVKLAVTANQADIETAKQVALDQLGSNVKVPGFRPGKAPANLIEKHVDPATLQSQVIDELVNRLYFESVQQEALRPVSQPSITLTKFVPFTELEFSAEVEVVGDIKMPDYKKIKATHTTATVTAKDVNDTLENLRQRTATREDVTRAAKKDDEVTIDFTGVDAKTGAPIAGADGKEYPLVLGSNSFIPGFEDELIGAKNGGLKTFTITFPKDYGAAELQNKDVTFTVTVRGVKTLKLPKLDDDFAKNAGPFNSLTELKADIKKQLQTEKQREADQKYVNDVIDKIAAKTEVAIPEALIEDEVERLEAEEKRNLAYRGQTWEEHLVAEGITAETHRERQKETAASRIKAGLILGEIANKEDISVSPEELELRIQLLKGRYTDVAMQAELDKPENRREIHSQMITEKTFDLLLAQKQ